MSQRIHTFTVEGVVLDLFVSDCASCGVVFGITKDLEERRRADRGSFYCPNGHSMVFRGKSDEQRLREAEAREVHLKDQLAAATREQESARVELLRIRSRIANGLCPCCRRTFQNVARHMETQHPDFAIPGDSHGSAPYRCSCGHRFDTFRGLRTHQGLMRPADWDRQDSKYWSHLSVVTK